MLDSTIFYVDIREVNRGGNVIREIIFLGMILLSQIAAANCPDLTGLYMREVNNKTVVFKVVTTQVEGTSVYEFEKSIDGNITWTWNSIADGKKHPKEIRDHVDVEEIATCKNNILHRKLTGYWPNGDEDVPFLLDADLSNPTPSSIRFYTDFSGYGMKHVITDETFERR